MSFGFRTMPSVTRKPAPSSSSCPGVRIVTLTERVSTRISSGSSTASSSVRIWARAEELIARTWRGLDFMRPVCHSAGDQQHVGCAGLMGPDALERIVRHFFAVAVHGIAGGIDDCRRDEGKACNLSSQFLILNPLLRRKPHGERL